MEKKQKKKVLYIYVCICTQQKIENIYIYCFHPKKSFLLLKVDVNKTKHNIDGNSKFVVSFQT